MKLKSLFLASLAAIAMASCSNEVEGVDNNGGEVAKDAKMQLSLAFPATTRAITDAGETYEQQINDLTVVVEYENVGKVIQHYTASQLVTGETDATKKQMTPTFDVASGVATVYAYANYGNEITLSNYKSYIETATYDKLTINNDVAKVTKTAEATTGNFHMNGFEGKTIEKAKTNYVLIKVSRVAAKLVESTEKEGYKYIPTGADYTNKGNMTITLTDYSFVNMNTTVNTIADNATTGNVNFYQPYNGAENTTCINVFPQDNRSITGTDKVSYCLANQTKASATNTNIIYKAKVNFEGAEISGTFYVRDNKEGKPTIYTLAQLKETFAGVYDKFDAETSIADWSKLGVKKYDRGVCYYKQEVTTGNDATILRNNLYKLNVLNIKDLGTPELDMPEPEKLTLLEVEIQVQAWTVIDNNIEL